MALDHPATLRKTVPFDAARLDAAMEAAGLDVIIATSKHNIQYLLGGYRFFFYDTMDAIGISRYQNALVYRKGRPGHAAYFGCKMETFELQLDKFWTPGVSLSTLTPADTLKAAAAHIVKIGGVRSVGVEADFLPAAGEAALRAGLGGGITIGDAFLPLERLRAVKTPAEIALLRNASEQVVAAMQEAFAAAQPGRTKAEVVEHLRRAEVNRGLVFDYCLMTAGTSLNRAPSNQKLGAGDVLSIDSGGNYHGYIGDLCRMGRVAEKPDAELVDLLGWVEEVQQAARALAKPGQRGADMLVLGDAMVERSAHKAYTDFMAHGMGLVSHEAPRLRNFGNTTSYPGYDADRPLEPGMVLSIETTMRHPKRGFIKLEDTIMITASGHEALGDGARGWNLAGS
jgi:Xaa-Pro aminopeptidase